MERIQIKRIAPLLILVGCMICLPALGASDENDFGGIVHKLLPSGPGPKAADLKVWTEKAKEEWAKAGIPAIVRVKSSEKGYLTAIYVSPSGDLIVLLPNKEMPSDMILPDKDYTLFGPESPVRLKPSEMAKDAKIIFCVSAHPLQLAPLPIPSGEIFARIPLSSSQDRKTLEQKLKALSKDTNFNLKALTLADRKKKDSRLDLMTLPTEITSSKPVGVTGTHGAKDKIVGPGKE
jgi:hypothetical protein